jgi:hypothetical protein
MTAISPFSLPGKFWRGNLHTHSTLSDGRLSPEEVVKAYRDAGYDFLMLSEHFVEHFDWPVADTHTLRTDDFTTIIGAELHVMQNSAKELWHIVAAGLPLDFAPPEKGETGPEIARRAAKAGAFVGIAHPAWSLLTLADGLSIDAAHAVEIYNHGSAIEIDRGDGFYLLDQLLNEGKRLTGFATDDTHFTNFSDDAFGGWVQVKSESLDPDALLAALKAGHYYSSQGPQIHALAITNGRLEIECSPVDNIVVAGGTSRTATHAGRAITKASIDMKKLETGLYVPEPSPWLRVTIIDHAGKRAWSNPIWLDEL